jgi:hypothetical protein
VASKSITTIFAPASRQHHIASDIRILRCAYKLNYKKLKKLKKEMKKVMNATDINHPLKPKIFSLLK